MFRKSTIVMILVLGACVVNSASALYLKVDFAYPEYLVGDPCFVERFDLTAKDGWFPWADGSFKDLWRHDGTWAATYPEWGPLDGGIDGTGINIKLNSGGADANAFESEGDKRLMVYGMQTVTDGGYATGHPGNAEPIANSAASCFSNKPTIFMTITGLGPGTYYLDTYHNCAWDVNDANYWGDDAVGAFNIPDINMAKIWVRGADITQTVMPEDIKIQREQVDANLIAVTTVFIKTDVCDCNIAFVPGPNDGKAVVNAFILSTGRDFATEPDPGNDAINVCPGESLCWTPGEAAGAHDVYFGTNSTDVDNATTATSGIYKETLEQIETCYTPTGLELDTTYYWRIDEVNDSDPCVWKGDVWTFTTNDGNAFDPYPADDATKIPLDVSGFSWGAGCSAVSHDVFFGTNADDVNSATPESYPNVTYTPGATSGSYDPPGPLEYGTHYYWRVDAVGSGGQRWQGKTWHFRSEMEVEDPSLLVWYKFDELPPSSIALDSSGNEYDGSIYGDVNDWDPTGGQFGGSRIFGGSCTLPASVPKTLTSAVSITMWLKDLPISYDDNWTNSILNADSGNIPDWRMRIMVPSNQDSSDDWPGYILWRAGMEPNDRLSWDLGGVRIDELYGWHHWVFIKDEITQTMKIYFDGSLVASSSGTTIANLSEMWPSNIGIGSQGSASMDDFRIYNRALSDANVLEVFRGGDLWSAWFPQPRDFETKVAPDVTLKWNPGDYADSHDVYFGNNWDDVNEATTASSEFVDNMEPNSYDLTDLDLGKTYYWRVDEVNESDPCIWKGKVWRFSTNYIVIDDFESYNYTGKMKVVIRCKAVNSRCGCRTLTPLRLIQR